MKWLIIVVSLVLGGFVHSQYQADDVIGRYHAPDGVGKIEIYKKNGKYYGKAICCNADRLDTKNPDPKLRDRSIIGMNFMYDFEWDGEATYRNGQLYYHENGKTYDCVMWIDGNILKVRGYLGLSAFGKTVSFKRVMD